MIIRPYIRPSRVPIKETRFVITLVVNLSFMYEPNTRRLMMIAARMNGNGTGEPGFGIHAVRSGLIVYPGLQSKTFGTQPSPVLFISKFSGQLRPSQMHMVLSSLATHFSGQYCTQLLALKFNQLSRQDVQTLI